MPRELAGFYGIVDQPRDAEAAARLAASLLAGGAHILQLRMKGVAADLLRIANRIVPLCRAQAALFIVNDRLDVALAAEADGVHLGQEDLPLAAARRLVHLAPRGFIVGISTHSLAEAEAAWAAGADYIGAGPVFRTTTKANPAPTLGLARLAEICRLAPVPVVAIGGITLENVAEVVRAGATAAALISAVNAAPEVTRAARIVTSAFLSVEN